MVQTLLDNAAADPDRDVETLITRLQEVNARAAALTKALLLLSRSDQRAFDRDSVDLRLVTEDAAETLSPLASTYGIRLDLTSHPAEVHGSTALLRQLASNLIHNAIVHHTAEHGHVWIRVQHTAQTAALAVENTGPIVAEAALARLTEPFARGATRTRVASPEHHGACIARAHGGELVLAACRRR